MNKLQIDRNIWQPENRPPHLPHTTHITLGHIAPSSTPNRAISERPRPLTKAPARPPTRQRHQVIAQRHRPAAAEARVPLEHLELLELVANGVGNGRVVVGESGLAAEMANCYRNTNSISKYITNYLIPLFPCT